MPANLSLSGSAPCRVAESAPTPPTRLALRPDEAAAALGISRGTFDQLVADGRIPFVQLTERVKLFPIPVLEKWLEREIANSGPIRNSAYHEKAATG